MDKILVKLRIKGKNKNDKKSLQNHLSDEYDIDSDYVIKTDRSVSYDRKHQSLSYTHLYDSIKDLTNCDNQCLSGSHSHRALNTEPKERQIKSRSIFWTESNQTFSNPTKTETNGFKTKLLSKFWKKSSKAESSNTELKRNDRNQLHVQWYAPDITESDIESHVNLQDSAHFPIYHKQLATSIAAELTTISKSNVSMFRNTDKQLVRIQSDSNLKS